MFVRTNAQGRIIELGFEHEEFSPIFCDVRCRGIRRKVTETTRYGIIETN
jgi:hypothetical protein